MPRPLLARVLAACSLAAGLALATPALLPTDAQATVIADMTLEQRVDAAEYIVRGTVVDIWTEVDHNNLVWTRNLVEISEVLKGPQVDTLVISTPGGSFGALKTGVVGAARFSVGEEVIAFASQRGEGRIQLVGMQQGKFTVRLDPASRAPVVQRWTPPAHQDYDHRFIPTPAAADRVFLDDFVDRVVDRVELGWDGQPIPGIPIERLRRVNKLQPGVE